MVGIVQVGAFGCEQFNGLSNAPWLIDGALFADGQMHGQVQKRVARAVIEIAL
jgi:hypothetical protein